MKKVFKGILFGILICIVFKATIRESKLLLSYLGFVGIGLVLLAGIFSGALGSGDRIRANYSNESAQDRVFRTSIASMLFGVSLGVGIGAGIIYLFLKAF